MNMFIMYKDVADINDIVIATINQDNDIILKEGVVLDKRLVSNSEGEVFSIYEFLVKSDLGEKWISGYFIRRKLSDEAEKCIL